MNERMIELEKAIALAVKEKNIAESMYKVAVAERNYERAIVDRLKEENAQLKDALKSSQ